MWFQGRGGISFFHLLQTCNGPCFPWQMENAHDGRIQYIFWTAWAQVNLFAKAKDWDGRYAADLAYIRTAKEAEILIGEQADSHLLLDALSLQSSRLPSSHGELIQMSESSQSKVSNFRGIRHLLSKWFLFLSSTGSVWSAGVLVCVQGHKRAMLFLSFLTGRHLEMRFRFTLHRVPNLEWNIYSECSLILHVDKKDAEIMPQSFCKHHFVSICKSFTW